MSKKKVNFGVIIQARMGSTRLPNKILLKYKKFTPLEILIGRLRKSKKIDEIYIATTKRNEDQKIINFCKSNSIKYFRGATNNVLSRYYFTSKKFNISNVIRITSDCPLVDYRTIDDMIETFKQKKINYYANTYPLPTTFPDGMDIEIFTKKTLSETYREAKLPSEKEHVTPYMYKNKRFKTLKKDNRNDLSNFRFCIDYKEDYKLLCNIINSYNSKIFDLSMKSLVNYVKKNPHLINYQKEIKRNEGWSSALKKDKKYI